MKANLEFDLENLEDRQSHFRCVKSLDMALALFQIQVNLRKKCENSNVDVYEEISNILEEYNINIDELVS